MDHEETLLTITAMRRQEESEYFTRDYFHLNIVEDDEQHERSNTSNVPASPTKRIARRQRTSCSSLPCDSSCRQIMFQWMIRVVDFFPSMHRTTVAHAMSYLDRFLQTAAGQTAREMRSEFQLAAIACLYTAVKLHERSAVSPKFLQQLSGDEYSAEDLTHMELTVLQALGWRLTTPIAVDFLRQFWDVIPAVLLPVDASHKKNTVQDEIFAVAKHQTEVAMGNYQYVTVYQSTIAFCALSNALDMFVPKAEDKNNILWYVSQAAHMERPHRNSGNDSSFGSAFTQEISRSLAADASLAASRSSKTIPATDGGLVLGYEAVRHYQEDEEMTPSGHHSPRTVHVQNGY